MNVDRDIDQLIFDIAEFNREEDMMSFYEMLPRTELYFTLSGETPSIDSGEEFTVRGKNRLTVNLAKLENGKRVVVFYTTKDDFRLGRRYGGIVGIRGIEMVSKMSEADGLIVQNKGSSWFGMDKQQLEKLYMRKV